MGRLICIDYETASSEGASTETWRKDFRALSCAFTWEENGKLISEYCVGEDAIKGFLSANLDADYLAHNIAFEMGVTLARFPELKLNFWACTQRLLQMADGGGLPIIQQTDRQTGEKHTLTKQFPRPAYHSTNLRRFPVKSCGLSLQAGIKRWLPKDYHDHKAPYYEYLREQGVRKGSEGKNLHRLPPDKLRDYNIADTENTFRLYNRLLKHFETIDLDWRIDHDLYLSSVTLIVASKQRGTRILRNKLAKYINTQQAKLDAMDVKFREMFLPDILELEAQWANEWVNGLKTERGRKKRAEKLANSGDLFRFSVNSTKHKTQLFVEKLKIKPKHFTEKGAPSFKKPFLAQWGEGGLLLKNKGTISIAKRQAENLLELSAIDGRYHADLKACGTATGRYAGGEN